MNSRGRGVYDESGRAVMVRGTPHDITGRKRMEEALRSEHTLRKAIEDSLMVGITAVDMEGSHTYANPAFYGMMGWSEEELIGTKPPYVYWPPEEVERISAVFKEVLSSGGSASGIELRFMRRNGERFEALVLPSPLKDEKGQIIGWLGSFYDITERKRMEADMRVKDNAIATSISGIAFADLRGNLTYVNGSFVRMLGYEDEGEVIGKSAMEFYHVHEEIGGFIDKLLEEGGWRGDLTARREDGSLFNAHMSASVVRDNEGRPICMMGSFEDITQQKAMEEKLHRVSITDELTGLLNRRGFMTLAERQLKVSERTGDKLFLYYGDLDNLKWANDNLGHKVGDRLLVEGAGVLRRTFRESDIIGRVGGDEFAVLATGATGDDDETRILKRIEDNIKAVGGRSDIGFDLSLSSGIVRYNAMEITSVEEFISRADMVMYESKRKKKKKRKQTPQTPNVSLKPGP